MQTEKRTARALRLAHCPRCARPLRPGAPICYFCGFGAAPPRGSQTGRPRERTPGQQPRGTGASSRPAPPGPARRPARVRLRSRAPLAPLASSISAAEGAPSLPGRQEPGTRDNALRSAIAAWPTQPQRLPRRAPREPSTAVRAAIAAITTRPTATPPRPETPQEPEPAGAAQEPGPPAPARTDAQARPLYRTSWQPLERLRWWLLRPGHIEFLLWIGGTFLLLLMTFVLVLAMLLSFGWLQTAPVHGPAATPDHSSSSPPAMTPTATALPSLALIEPGTAPLQPGMTLQLRGQGFSRFAPVMFWFDRQQPFVDAHNRPVLVEADAQGRFTVTLHLLPSWSPGHHQIMAKDMQTKQIALLTINLTQPIPASQGSSQNGNGSTPTATPGPGHHPPPTPTPSITPATPQPAPSQTPPTATLYPPTARPAPSGSVPPATATTTMPASPSLTPGTATASPPRPSATAHASATNGLPVSLASLAATPPAPNENAQALPLLLCSTLMLTLPLLLLLITRSRLLARFLSHLLP